jgi:hypothetical protein
MNRDRKNTVRVLKESIGETGTEALTSYVHLTTKEEFANFRTSMKEDFADFRGEMQESYANFRSEMKGDFANFRSEVKGDLSKLEIKISDTKSDTIRWMFAFFVTMLLALIGLYFKK